MKTKILKGIWILAVLLSYKTTAQSTLTISGYVRDKISGEDLIGVTIYSEAQKSGAITNAYGYFSMSMPEGQSSITISYLGYNTQTLVLDLSNDQNLNFDLVPSIEELDEVVITSARQNANVTDNQMSAVKLQAKTIKEVPVVLGEADLIKTIQLLPGVSGVADGASGFNVRGGSADQNLILLDEGIIYNSSHLLGFFSVVNPDAIKGVTLYKGGIPARYGGRLSSVVDIRQREGNSKYVTGAGGISLVAARGLVEGPLKKDKSSFMIAGRRSYGDAILKLMGEQNTAFFYDLNVKTNYTINQKNRLFASGYFGRDKFELGRVFSNSWGNATATIRWNHVFSDRLFANFSLIYSNYDYSIDVLTPGVEYNWQSNIINWTTKADFNYFIDNQNHLEFGVDHKWYEFRPGEMKPIMGSNVIAEKLDNKFGQETGIYVDYEKELGPLTIKVGIRQSIFVRRGNQTIATYEGGRPVIYNQQFNRYERGTVLSERNYSSKQKIAEFYNLEPRAAATLVLNEEHSIKVSYNRLYQYLHLISNSTSPTPLDVWAPSGPFIKPQSSDQAALGYFRNFKQNTYEFSIEGYYKWMDNLVDYVDGADLLTNNNIETELLVGKGLSYGLEFYLKKSKGDLTGWISYTLSKAERQVKGLGLDDPGINQGNFYPADYDKRHDLSVTASYKINDRWSLSSNFIFASGRPTTYPRGKYEFAGLLVPQFENRNLDRISSYNRLDLSATLKGKRKKWKNGGHEWIFGLYNVYNRKNASSVYFKESDEHLGEAKPYKSFLFGITPSITYNFKF